MSPPGMRVALSPLPSLSAAGAAQVKVLLACAVAAATPGFAYIKSVHPHHGLMTPI